MEPREFDLEAELNALESVLRGIEPAPSNLNRDRLMFEAGRGAAKAESRGRLLLAASFVLSIVSVGSVGLLLREQSRTANLMAELAIARAHFDAAKSDSPDLPPLPFERPSPTSYLALSRNLDTPDVEIRGRTDQAPSRPGHPAGDELPRPVLNARSKLEF